VILKIIGQGAHNQKVQHCSREVAGYLNVNAEFEQPIAVKKDTYN
jgi:hypothetical protein